MNDRTYNGWTNYETWCCALWLDNDGDANYWRDTAQEMVNDAGSKEETDVSELAGRIEEQLEEGMPEVSGMFADLLRGAFDEIDFREIAEHYIADCDEPAKDTEEES